jgi:hypothetical protein
LKRTRKETCCSGYRDDKAMVIYYLVGCVVGATYLNYESMVAMIINDFMVKIRDEGVKMIKMNG